MITKEKIARLNELAANNKTDGLTEKELEEREQLRREYIESVRENLKAQLDNIEFTDEEPKN